MNVVTVRRICKGWLIVDVLGSAFVFVFAVAHYGFDAPIYDRDTGRLATEAEIAWIVGLLAVCFVLFAVMGAFGLRRCK